MCNQVSTVDGDAYNALHGIIQSLSPATFLILVDLVKCGHFRIITEKMRFAARVLCLRSPCLCWLPSAAVTMSKGIWMATTIRG